MRAVVEEVLGRGVTGTIRIFVSHCARKRVSIPVDQRRISRASRQMPSIKCAHQVPQKSSAHTGRASCWSRSAGSISADRGSAYEGLCISVLSQIICKNAQQNFDKIQAAIDYTRDFGYDYFGFKTLERSYLLKVGFLISAEVLLHSAIFFSMSVGVACFFF